MIRYRLILSLFLVGGLLLAGCSDRPSKPTVESPDTAMEMPPQLADRAPADTEMAKPEIPENPVLVQVNGTDIRQADLLNQRRIMMQQGMNISPQEALGQVVAETMIIQAAEKAGIVVNASDIDAAYNNVATQEGGEEAFEQKLAMAGLTPAAVKQDISHQMSLEKAIEWKTADVTVPDASVEEAFANDPESLERVKARHILIRYSDEDGEEKKAEAQKRIQDIEARLKAGEDFEEVAKETSEDKASGMRGGDLGEFARGDMVPAFDAAAFTLEPGKLSDIIQTRFGYHLLKVDEHRSLTREEVSSQLEKDLRNQVLKSWLEELQKDAKILVMKDGKLQPVPGELGK